MRIVLCDRNVGMCDAWRALGTAYEVHHGDLFDIEAEAIVSPANSYGFMDGGVDARITEYLGPQVQERLQYHIRYNGGELLIGDSEWIETDHEVFKFVIAAPTMRVPQPILDPHVIFQAASAATLVAHELDLDSVIFPGMGTGVGKVPYHTSAKLMLSGIYHGKRLYMKQVEFPQTVLSAYLEHHNLKWETKQENFL